jgi:hypothetical protein
MEAVIKGRPDVAGDTVATSYSLIGNSLVLTVNLTNAVYPVVVDPQISWHWVGYTDAMNYWETENPCSALYLRWYGDAVVTGRCRTGSPPFHIGRLSLAGYHRHAMTAEVRDGTRGTMERKVTPTGVPFRCRASPFPPSRGAGVAFTLVRSTALAHGAVGDGRSTSGASSGMFARTEKARPRFGGCRFKGGPARMRWSRAV